MTEFTFSDLVLFFEMGVLLGLGIAFWIWSAFDVRRRLGKKS